MHPEILDMGSKTEEVRSRWGGVADERVEHRAFLGTFRKELICNLDETFSFANIAQAFKDDNKIHEVKITGKHNRNYFVGAEDLGRLNISVLVVEAQYTNNQKIIEVDALRSSEGSLSTLKVYSTPKGVDVRLDFLKPACPTLEELELNGVSVSVLTTEDFTGCSRLTSLTLLNTIISTLGTDVFKHLVNVREIRFSSLSKFRVQTGAFQNLDSLGRVDFYRASNHGDEESDHYNTTVISDGAFKNLPALYALDFQANIDFFVGVPFLGLSKLSEFRVYNGKQSSLQKLFDSAPKLWRFSFKSGLEHLEDGAFEGLPLLNEITLDGNRLTTLNKAFHGLPNVQYIDLSSNKLTSLDDSFNELPNIYRIDVPNNTLASISGVFENLQRGRINIEGNANLSPHTIIKQVVASDKEFTIKMSDRPLDCGCNMKWLAGDTAKLKGLGYGWMCKNGEPLISELGKTLLDLVEQYDNDDYDDFSDDISRIKYHDDLANKTILEHACPDVGDD